MFSVGGRVACERRRISGSHWFGEDNQQLEIRLRSQASGREDRQRNGSTEEKQNRSVKIGERIASAGHCRLQRNVLHEL